MEFGCVYVSCILYVAEAYYEIIVISVFAQEVFKIRRVVFGPAVLVLSVMISRRQDDRVSMTRESANRRMRIPYIVLFLMYSP